LLSSLGAEQQQLQQKARAGATCGRNREQQGRGRSAAGSNSREGATCGKMGKDSNVCLGCSKKFTKSDASIQCTVCGLWIHKVCANMSDEVFELLEKQKKESGITYWACRPCTVYAQGMNHRLRQIENDLKEVKESTATNTEAIGKLEKRVEEVAEIAKKNDGLSREEMTAMLREEREETLERKNRELNVILHGAEECGPEVQGGEERMRWDKEECLQLFNNLQLGVGRDDIKFCRRIGPKGDSARPLVIGFSNGATRNRVLKADTRQQAPELKLGPDLTKKQREEESNIWKEMEEKNKNRTAEEKSKNLVWRLVGPKGERRLVLGPDRGQIRAAATLGRGGQRPTVSSNNQRNPRWAGTRGRAAMGTPVLLDQQRNDQPFRPRLTSKRKEREVDQSPDMEESLEEDDGTREPPTKH
jgi:hypothetical protein